VNCAEARRRALRKILDHMRANGGPLAVPIAKASRAWRRIIRKAFKPKCKKFSKSKWRRFKRRLRRRRIAAAKH